MDARDLLIEKLPRTGRVLVQGCSGESALLADAVAEAGAALDGLTFTGIQIGGINRRRWLPGDRSRFETFFMTPELAAERARVDFLPLPYSAILRRWRSVPIDAALFAVSPPDADGLCSFGPAVDFLAELWPRIPLRIAHVNPLLPRTAGTPGIPIGALIVASDAPEAPVGTAPAPVDARTAAIAGHAAALVPDGATIQIGVGKLPGAILAGLRGRRGLRFHTGLIDDGVLDLIEAGATCGADVTTGVAIGSPRLYTALPDSGIAFRPVSYTHDAAVIARQPNMVTVNSAVEIDLFGQAHSECIAGHWNAGTGGATDFARGAALGGGTRIVALPAEARGVSRIVPAGAGGGPVTLARTDIDVVVTEHGAADLRDLSHDARAAALIAIAAPDYREALARSWRDGPGRY